MILRLPVRERQGSRPTRGLASIVTFSSEIPVSKDLLSRPTRGLASIVTPRWPRRRGARGEGRKSWSRPTRGLASIVTPTSAIAYRLRHRVPVETNARSRIDRNIPGRGGRGPYRRVETNARSRIDRNGVGVLAARKYFPRSRPTRGLASIVTEMHEDGDRVSAVSRPTRGLASIVTVTTLPRCACRSTSYCRDQREVSHRS